MSEWVSEWVGGWVGVCSISRGHPRMESHKPHVHLLLFFLLWYMVHVLHSFTDPI